MISLDDVRSARTRADGHVHRTPLMHTSTLATWAGVNTLSLKCESFQKTGSFKVRGALNAIAHLSESSKARGVISFSAGNHAQALAWASRTAGVRCTVVMPATASKSKAQATREYGAEVVLHGTPGEAYEKARSLEEEHGYTFVHPFDDDHVIAGTGGIGLELLEQFGGAPDLIVVPIGGGGLISGIAFAVKSLHPETRIIGVEPDGASAMRQSLDAGRALRLDSVSTIADGLAAPMAGVRNLEVVQRYVDDVVLVTDDEIALGMKALLERCKLFIEPGGAAATAALLAKRISVSPSDRVVALVSGGNVDLDRVKQLL